MDIPVQKKTKDGMCIRDEKPSLLRVACALRGMLDDVIQGVGVSPGIQNLLEYAAQNMITEGVSSEEPGIEPKDVKTEESVTTFAHSCAHHAKLMDIALWSKLPEELQELVFSRLPWPQIYRVQILSKGWNQKLMSGTQDSQLKRACARAQPKSFALIAQGDGPGSFTVNMFDIASNRWHAFETSPGFDPECDETKLEVVSASDGGLVCFFSNVQSKSKKTPRFVFVCNPLTRVWKQLPPLYGIVHPQIMVQLIMDRVTKHYRVLVAGYCKGPKVGTLVNVYHSETGQWTRVDGSSSGEVVYGYLYNFNEQSSTRFKPALCSYNFADGLVHEIVTNFPGNYSHKSDLVKDHLFRVKDVALLDQILWGQSTESRNIKPCIEEYQAVNCGASWTLLKEYSLNVSLRSPQRIQPLRSPQRIQPDIYKWFPYFFACKDFLLLFVLTERLEGGRCEFLFIYEFSVEEWRELPMMPRGRGFFFAQKQMCELRFDSVP